MVNKDKGKAEQFVLRGNADSVMRQLVDEYNSSNGWSVNRIVNNILNFTVVLERNSEQGVSNKDTSKDTSSNATKDTSKNTDKEVTKMDTVADTLDTTDVDTVEKSDDEAVEPVKTAVKSTRKTKS